jgi:hypothetical protein
VNACEGIADPDVVPELLRLVKQAYELKARYSPDENGRYNSDLLDAIARAEGRDPKDGAK